MAGLLLWYTNNFPSEVVVFFAFEVLVLLIAMIIASIWARRKIKTLVGMAHVNTDDTEGMDWNDGPRESANASHTRKKQTELAGSIVNRGFSDVKSTNGVVNGEILDV
ncbi:hypothetical protein FOPG_20167 [Fusarium oxysporum f. sp. conglutinans race 2 54008]|uniref:Uncharacterized protein n=1 Tax=Fusarium oxysporum f. sp. conglutinans race 2 54008 TaxID=1089457 RepID=X0GUG2_FUSOX|nr:hypothetical protein FOPG_20167 [Fusarium oxysporum f. sp. conglutinans race 2 54008]